MTEKGWIGEGKGWIGLLYLSCGPEWEIYQDLATGSIITVAPVTKVSAK